MTTFTQTLYRIALGAGMCVAATSAQAAEIGVVGLFPGKAVLVVNGASPKTYSVGASVSDTVKLVAVSDTAATIDNAGKRQTISIGEHINNSASGKSASITIAADSRGHFLTRGQINGSGVEMLVDTGATLIALPSSEAVRLGIDYKKGTRVSMGTANGVVPAYLVRLDTVKIGDIEIAQVDAVIQEVGLPIILLGNSFLNRTDMRRDGTQMTLTKRF